MSPSPLNLSPLVNNCKQVLPLNSNPTLLESPKKGARNKKATNTAAPLNSLLGRTSDNIACTTEHGEKGPLRFGFLMAIPRNEAEGKTQIPQVLSMIQDYHPDLIGLVSPTDRLDDETHTRTRMWGKMMEEIRKIGQAPQVFQHLPYTSVGNRGWAYYDEKGRDKLEMTAKDLQDRVQDIKKYGVENVLALKGWEGWTKSEERSCPVYQSTADWVGSCRQTFSGLVAATTYIEGHYLRRAIVPSGEESSPEWVAVQMEAGEVARGIHMKDWIAGMRCDIQKIKQGATALMSNMVFDAELFLTYRSKFHEVWLQEAEKDPELRGTKYQLWAEVALGGSKRAFIDKVTMGSVYCSPSLRQRILNAGSTRFDTGSRVSVIFHGESSVTTVDGTILQKNADGTYQVQHLKAGKKRGDSDSVVEATVPIERLSDDEADREVRNIWVDAIVELIQRLKEHDVPFVYVMSFDAETTRELMEKSAQLNLFDTRPLLEKGERLFHA